MSTTGSAEIMTSKEVCEFLGISRVTLWRRVNDGEIRHYRMGRVIRFSREHINEYLKAHERKPMIAQRRGRR